MLSNRSDVRTRVVVAPVCRTRRLAALIAVGPAVGQSVRRGRFTGPRGVMASIVFGSLGLQCSLLNRLTSCMVQSVE